MSHLILVDGNNLGFAGMASPRLSAGDTNTQATFTVIKKLRNLFLDNPNALIMVLWDGRSWRKDIYSDYKGKRETTDKQVEARQAYYEQKASLIDGLRYLGMTQCSASNMEADDLAEIYSRKWKGDKVTLFTGDKDWLQLIDERTSWIDPILDRQCNHLNFKAFTGFEDTEQFVEAKCILGDKDEVPGLKGIGPKTLAQVYEIWYSFYYGFLDGADQEKEWELIHGKSLPKVLDDCRWNYKKTWEELDFNRKLADLKTKHRPEPINLVQNRQDLNSESFKAFCHRNAFLSFLRDYDKFLKPFKENKYVRVRQTSPIT
jgi:DNA polymerase-1